MHDRRLTCPMAPPTVAGDESIQEERMSRMIRRFTAAGTAALLAVTLVAGPASAAPDPKARYGDSMVIGITGDPGTLNGTTSSNFVEKIIASNVFSMDSDCLVNLCCAGGRKRRR